MAEDNMGLKSPVLSCSLWPQTAPVHALGSFMKVRIPHPGAIPSLQQVHLQVQPFLGRKGGIQCEMRLEAELRLLQLPQGKGSLPRVWNPSFLQRSSVPVSRGHCHYSCSPLAALHCPSRNKPWSGVQEAFNNCSSSPEQKENPGVLRICFEVHPERLRCTKRWWNSVFLESNLRIGGLRLPTDTDGSNKARMWDHMGFLWSSHIFKGLGLHSCQH